MEPKVIVIVGPTCSGKTKLSLLIAEMINCEIISADSRQIYKYLNIGTAKPSSSELSKVKHHFIDQLDPSEKYSSSKFENQALAVIRDLILQNKVPLVVGGSGLYVKALIDGIFNSADTDDKFRNELLKERKKFGNQYIYDKLKEADPKSAAELLPQNWKRVIRALEVLHLTGQPIWKHQENYNREKEFEFLQIGLNWERENLYRNIEMRVDQMFDEGLVAEVKGLLDSGFDPSLNALNTVGYKETISYLKNEISLKRCIELIKRNTRRFAKRQMTWFRKDSRIKWFDVSGDDELSNMGSQIINKI